MHLSLLTAIVALSNCICAATVQQQFNKVDQQLSDWTHRALAQYLPQARPWTIDFSQRCNRSNLALRREWNTLSRSERKAFTNAVLCLQFKPAKTPSSFAPGARTRFDDWVVTHVDQSLSIHYTGTFLTWHRWFIWLYEQALRQECGYTGTLPYWNWASTARTGLKNSTLFDGSEYSMSGDGERLTQAGDIALGGGSLPILTLPVGQGGGCIKTGPFKNMVVNLGPAALAVPGNVTLVNPNGPLSYNPRCLRRDLTDAINRRYANASSILHTLRQPTIQAFQMTMQGIPGSNDIGIHGGGHYSLGGDPGRDISTSPADPAFYLHHSMIDRVWWLWQTADPSRRIHGNNAISGTHTFLNTPPSADVTLDTEIEMKHITNRVVTMRDLMSTVSANGLFCYIYV